MDISTDSDEDDCQLYSRTAEHFIKNRDAIQAKRRELEKVIDLGLLPENEIEDALNDYNFTNRPLFTVDKSFEDRRTDSDVSLISKDGFSSSEDDVPLSELRRSLMNKRHRQSPPALSRKRTKRQSRRKNQKIPSSQVRVPQSVRDLGVIVLDDDAGYSMNSLPPIDFNSRSYKKSRLSDEGPGDISSINIYDDSEDESIDENDDLVTLTIEWNNSQKTTRKEFKLRRYQKFESVFEELAAMENISTNRVLLMYDFSSVNPWDTPSSLNLKFYGALMGSISSTEIIRNKVNVGHENVNESMGTPGGIQVKLLLQSKQTLLFSVLKHQKMDILYKKCAEELKCEKTNLKLTFDGEHVEPSDLVAELDIEDGDVFHVYVKNS